MNGKKTVFFWAIVMLLWIVSLPLFYAVASGEENLQEKNTQEKNTVLNSEDNNISKELDPSISVYSRDIEGKGADKGYFSSGREISVSIIDESELFDADKAIEAISITAVDQNGKDLNIDSNDIIPAAWNNDGDLHTAVLNFKADGFYEWSISYTDKAGRTLYAGKDTEGVIADGSSGSEFEFCIDGTRPETAISDKEGSSWYGLSADPAPVYTNIIRSFGSEKCSDAMSGVKDVSFYTHEGSVQLKEDELAKLYDEGMFSSECAQPDSEGSFIIYARVSDKAGNAGFASTPVIIFDRTECGMDMVFPEPDSGAYYNSDIDVSVTASDNSGSSSGSGISLVKFTVKNCNENAAIISQQGVLYSSETERGEALDEWTGNFTVDASLNNSDNVYIELEVRDNAGNISMISKTIKIYSAKPSVTVYVDGKAGKIIDDQGYFKTRREAEITVRERASLFREDNIESGIYIEKIKDGKIEHLKADNLISKWKHNGDTHTASLDFSEEGNYRWRISYTSPAGLSADVTASSGSETPYHFTIDMTAPESGSIRIGGVEDSSLERRQIFSHFSKDDLAVELFGRDSASPVILEYILMPFESSIEDTEPDDNSFKVYRGEFRISESGRERVCLRVTDYAGNYVYYYSDGIIIDRKSSNVNLTVDRPNAYGIWADDVNIAIKADETGAGSGIKSVTYYVLNNGKKVQSGSLFDDGREEMPSSHIKENYEGNVVVDAVPGNGCNTLVDICVTDHAGNVSDRTVKLDIDIISPEISISYDNNDSYGEGPYYHSRRTATVIIKERNRHFDSSDAYNGITISANDAKGNNVKKAFSYGKWETVTSEEDDDETVHKLKIYFSRDAVYKLDIAYTDKAGNRSEEAETGRSRDPFSFMIDREAPASYVSAAYGSAREKWNSLRRHVLREIICRDDIRVKCESSDDISGIKKTEYIKIRYKSGEERNTKFSAEELENTAGWKNYDNELLVSSDEKSVICFRITDNAGNRRYINTDYILVDKASPEVGTAAAYSLETNKIAENALFNSDVGISLSVLDPYSGGTYSGISSISYEVYNHAADTAIPTQQGVIYSDDSIYSEGRQKWSGVIRVNASVNNSNDIRVIIKVTDKAMNSSSKTVHLKIDVSRPEVSIAFDRNDPVNGKYFNSARKAFVTVKERNFSPDLFKISGKSSEDNYSRTVKWKRRTGTGNGDDTLWTAEFIFKADAEYSFDAECTDLAGNKNKDIVYEKGTKAGKHFVIDSTKPRLYVSYDNNEVRNKMYYRSGRTAEIKVADNNILYKDISIKVTAERDGSIIKAPKPEKVVENGDGCVFTLDFKDDAVYSVEIVCEDLAGNRSQRYKSVPFCIDRTCPDINIEGIKDKEAVNGSIKPAIIFSDDNIETDSVKWTLRGADNGEVEYPGTLKKEKGKVTFSYDDFERDREKDDIYTLTAQTEDKAGNKTEKKIVFYVDRYGSVFVPGREVEKINRRYIQKASDISFTEFSVSGIKDERIVLFFNNRSRELVRDRDYNISETGGGDDACVRKYTIYKDNFAYDGIYSFMISTEDNAGNISDNEINSDYQGIRFAVDSTAPVTEISNLSTGMLYSGNEYAVKIYVRDNLKLRKVSAWLDGIEVKKWTDDEVMDVVNASGYFRLIVDGGSSDAHNLRIEAWDEAGNADAIDVKDFYVMADQGDNVLKRVWIVLPFILLSASAGIVIFMKIKKKRKSVK